MKAGELCELARRIRGRGVVLLGRLRGWSELAGLAGACLETGVRGNGMTDTPLCPGNEIRSCEDVEWVEC